MNEDFEEAPLPSVALAPVEPTSSRHAYRFASGFSRGAPMPDFDQDAVKSEPMLFNCDAASARRLGGPITRAFLDALGFDPVVVDTRVHMLMPGWFPCIPGFHHDDVPRTRPDGQPDYDDPPYRSKHAMALINGEIAATEFAVGYCDMPAVPLGETIYKVWHQEVERLLASGELQRQHAPSNRVVWFDDEAFHQGVRATGAGWRWFGRASWNTDRKPTNEVRRQVQVYLENPMEGW